jgi:hypothetical protein
MVKAFRIKHKESSKLAFYIPAGEDAGLFIFPDITPGYSYFSNPCDEYSALIYGEAKKAYEMFLGHDGWGDPEEVEVSKVFRQWGLDLNNAKSSPKEIIEVLYPDRIEDQAE